MYWFYSILYSESQRNHNDKASSHKKAACLSSFSWVSTIYYLANFDRICAKSR